MKSKIVCFLAAISFSVAMYSVNNTTSHYRVKGLIVDSITNKVVSFVTVRISNSLTPKTIIQAQITKDNGVFSFSLPRPGRYVVNAQLIGKNPINKTVIFGKRRFVDLGTLKMSDQAHGLQEVVVTSQKPLIKVELDKISYNMAEDPDSKTSNVLDMMKKVPMITVDGDENIQLKGSSDFKVYVDGKPSNMITKNPKEVLKSMPASSIQSIQVITDPGSKYDAEGTAGIINIITKKNTSLSGYVATLGAYGSSKGNFGGYGYGSYKYGKFGVTANYGYYNGNHRQSQTTDSYRENKMGDINTYLTQTGSTQPLYDGHYGSVEVSYEIDSLNLVDMGGSFSAGTSGSEGFSTMSMLNRDHSMAYQYNMLNNSNANSLWGEYYFDYQRTFHKKGELLTFSYKMSTSPGNKSWSDNTIDQPLGTLPPAARSNRQYSTTDNAEHTFQVDYTNPFTKEHSLEAGAKYIMRPSGSVSGYDTLDNEGDWQYMQQLTDNFKHREDILAAYASYNLKLKKWGLKAGARYEKTWMNAKFAIDPTQNFHLDYGNLLPSVLVTYKLNDAQNFRIGYNMRMSRPSIYQLNPYRNNTNPNYITQGNPNLDAVLIHNLNFNYGLFNKTISLNANIGYSFENNNIQNVTTIIQDGSEKGASYTTYQNIGRMNAVNSSVYFRWSIIKNLNLTTNLHLNYLSITSNNGTTNLSNKGFSPRVFGYLQYTFPHSWRLMAVGGYFGRSVTIQGRTPAYHFEGIGLQKSFLKDRLTARTFVAPFVGRLKTTTTESTDAYYYVANSYVPHREIMFSISYRFGGMKTQIKKAKGIENDDTSTSNNSSQKNDSQSSGM